MGLCDVRDFPGEALSGHATRRSRGFGFTIVELLVASVVMSVALLGVYSIFAQAMQVQSQTSVRWNEQAAAEAMVAHFADVLERCVNLPEVPALVAGPDSAGEGYFLTCCATSGRGGSSDPLDRGGIQRRRYRWGFGSEEDRAGTIEVQTLSLAGTKIVSVWGEMEGGTEEEIWSRVPATVVGRRVGSLSVLYRKCNDPQSTWQDHWRGNAGEVAIWIRVGVGGETVERLVVPQADGFLVNRGSE